ncbi:MAG: 4-hydroxy-tetrahydrodipicolinate synthase [Sphingobacteriales bacterium]|nr:MAG: 4-hydroxy-tetrahydrodipicolinate synthase [Sphingobacteriales bacterium]
MTNNYRGTGVALVTPFLKDGKIDYPSLEKIINHVIEGGVNYLVVLGTTGETPTLSEQEKKEVLAFAVEKCADRVPVVCGIGGNNTAEVVAQLKEFDLSGVSAILTVSPYYNKPSQEGLYQHFKAIAEATDKEIILYNVPGRTSSNILPETALKLAREYRKIVAIKEASGNIAQCMDLVKDKPDHFAVLSGDDDLIMAQIAIGMEGVISVAANCFTKDFTYMVNACLVNKFDKARVIQYKIIEGIRLLFAEGNPPGVKAVLKEMGLCQDYLRLPLVPVTEGTRKRIKQFLTQYNG